MVQILLTWLGKLISKSIRILGHGGSALPGYIIEKIYSTYISDTLKKFNGKVIVVTGTNGKTTTTKMIASIFRASGKKIITNKSGSNLRRGVISTLAEKSSLYGKVNADYLILELDEAEFSNLTPVLKPDLALVTNASRDQLDRYGEINTLVSRMREGADYCKVLYLNNDDPKLEALKESKAETRYFGAEPHIRKLLPSDEYLYKKSSQELRTLNGDNIVTITTIENNLTGVSFIIEGQNHKTKIQLKLPGIFNAYNAAAAFVIARHLDIGISIIKTALASMNPAFGRGEKIYYRNKGVQIFLVKNPAGFNQISKLVSEENHPLLIVINDNFADGKDVSWLWDSDLEALRNYQGPIITSGIRAYDMALRLKYEEIKVDKIIRNIGEALDYSLSLTEEGIIAIPNYTSMLEMRSYLLNEEHTKEWR